MSQLHHVQQTTQAPSTYIAPSSLKDALEVLAEHGERARPIAGGTDLLLELNRGARTGIDVLLDLSVLPELAQITEREGTIHLGATVTHSAVIGDRRIAERALPLAQACMEVGSPALRNRATVVGNIVTASPANDTISALFALDANITIESLDAKRTVPITEFYSGFRTTVLRQGELVTGISFDALGLDRRGIFVKLGLRRAQAISVVHAAAVARFAADGTVDELTLALGSVGPTIELAPEAAALAIGRELADAADEVAVAAANGVTPIDDLRSSADYRRHGLELSVGRALRTLGAGDEAATWPPQQPRLTVGEFPRQPSPVKRRTRSDADSVTCTVNGREVSAANAVGKSLLDWLRDELALSGTKEGCAEGECGACTVHLDRSAVLACLVPAVRAENSTVVTIEGVADGEELHAVQEAFENSGAVQCGFCTPGFVMSSVMLDQEMDNPTRLDVERALAGNLCRCTGYYSIIDAVRSASR